MVGIFGIGVAVLLALMWKEHGTGIELNKPNGDFAVGRTSHEWVNSAETDELAPDGKAKREVLVWIWYPAAETEAAKADYLPAPWRAAMARHSGVLMTRFLTRDPGIVHGHSSEGPAVSPKEGSYPVVILRAGGGAPTTDFTTLAEDLASHGYVVVGFDAPYRSGIVVFPDGRVVQRPRANDPEGLPSPDGERLAEKLLALWVGDTRFVVDQLERLNRADPTGRFTGRLNLGRLGMAGHSLGGATALQYCHDDARCKAGINLDGNPFGSVVRDGLKQPVLFLLSDHGEMSDPEAREVFGKIKTIYDRLPDGRLLLKIRGANHFTFSDQIVLKSHYIVGALAFASGGLDARRGLAIAATYVHTFLDVHLRNAPSSRLDDLRQKYPEVLPAVQEQ